MGVVHTELCLWVELFLNNFRLIETVRVFMVIGLTHTIYYYLPPELVHSFSKNPDKECPVQQRNNQQGDSLQKSAQDQ